MNIESVPKHVREAAAAALRAEEEEIIRRYLRHFRSEADFAQNVEPLGGKEFIDRIGREDLAALVASLESDDFSIANEFVRQSAESIAAQGLSLSNCFLGKRMFEQEVVSALRRSKHVPDEEREALVRLVEGLSDRTVFTMVGAYEVRIRDQARATEDDLARTQDLLESVLASARRFGIFSTDSTGKLVYFSEGAESLFGWSAAEVMGKNPEEVLLAPEERADSAHAYEVLAKDGVAEDTRRVLRRDGGTFEARITLTARHDAHGKVVGVTGVLYDVTEERDSQRFLALMAHAIESSHEGVALSDLDGKITYVNPALARMLRVPREDLVGCMGHGFAPEVNEAQAAEIRKAAHADGWNGKLQARRADGSTFPLRVSYSAVRDEHDRVVAMVSSVHDLSRENELQTKIFEQERLHLETLEREVKERTAEIETANRELQELDEMKDRFLANVSHELRTPLVSALGYVELALHGQLGRLSEEARDGLAVAHRNVLRLVGLIEDLLTYARVQSGRNVLMRAPVKMDHLITDALLDLKGRSSKKRLKIVSEIAPDLPRVDGDDEKISRVLANVLSNAEKFTGEEARIAVRARRANDGFVEVTIEDDGVGVPPEERERIFDRFYRSHSASARYPGTGIGLSLAREIVEAHGGRIWIESPAEGGTRVVFTLPEAKATTPAKPGPRAPAATPSEAPESTATVTILVIDDDAEFHDLLAVAFADRPWRLLRADSGAAGLAAAREAARSADEEARPALVLLDVSLGDMNGVEVCRRLKAEQATRDIPVYFLTARADERTATEAASSGCAGFITKPFSTAELADLVERAIESRGRPE